MDLRDVFMVRPVSGAVPQSAGMMTSLHALRAYDAVQLVTALVLRDEIETLQEAQEHNAEADIDQVLMLGARFCYRRVERKPLIDWWITDT